MIILDYQDKKFLKAILQPFEAHRMRDYRSDLGGYCGVISAVAERILNERNFLKRKWEAVEGDFLGETSRNRGHAWLIGIGDQDSIILDLTADQFEMSNPYCDSWPNDLYSAHTEDVGEGLRYSSSSWKNTVDASLKANGFFE